VSSLARRLARDESGFTLVELLVAATLMLIILGATLTSVNAFQKNNETNNLQNDAQDEARRGIDRLAKELRNLASPTNETPQAIKRKDPQDLIVQSVGETRPTGSLNARNTQYVRYCLNPDSQVVYRQTMTWTTAIDPAYPAATSCPGTGWDADEVVAQQVVNGSRALFTYNDADPLRTTEIHTSLWVDVDLNRRPTEVSLFSTVFLRNQNRVPAASFTAVRDGTSIILNGSDSQDPEERALYYFWYDQAHTGGPPVDDPQRIGEGIVYVYGPLAPGNHTVYLTVKDQADLASTAPPQTVCIPGGTVTC
jgi:prepilin-type N-terminal cleavage/methylation domain-containing protein